MHHSARRPMVAVIAAAALAGPAASLLHAGSVQVTYEQPTIDRWNYPFNPTPGARGAMSTFSSIPEPGFDERDGQALLMFDTNDDVPPGQGAGAYTVTAMTLTVMIEQDQQFLYDPTVDPWQSWLDESDPQFIDDTDAGRPIALSGVGFRDGLTLESYEENSLYCDNCDCFTDCVEVRHAFPIDFDAGAMARDISNNVRDQFDPSLFAVGAISAVAPGELVPTRTDVTFTVNVNDPDVQAYLADGLDRGRLAFMVTAQHTTVKFGEGFPTFYTKENINVPSTAQPARLSMTVDIEADVPGDITGDGIVDVFDLLAMLSAWGSCDGCPEDLNSSGAVDVFDLLSLLSHWS